MSRSAMGGCCSSNVRRAWLFVPGSFLIAALSSCSGPPRCAELPVVEASPSAGSALRFCGTGTDGVDRVKIRIDDPSTDAPGPAVDVGAADFTVEFWMRALPGENPSDAVECGANANWIYGNIVIDRDRHTQSREYGISLAGGKLVFGVRAGLDEPFTICGSTRIDDGDWHHVAATREGNSGALSLWVDGRLDGSSDRGPTGDISYPDDGVPGDYCDGPCVDSDPFLVFGAEKHDAGPRYPAFSGWLDEVRISTVVRYEAEFERPTTPFEPDDVTVGLWHFDEGRGDIVRDGSQEGSADGQIYFGGPYDAPRWVRSDAPLE